MELGQVGQVNRHTHNDSDSPKIPQSSIDDPIANITSDQVDALAGTGTPNSTNTYVTNDDVSDDGTVSKVVRLDGNGQATVATPPTENTHAASKGYVDGIGIWYAVASDTDQATDLVEASIATWATRKSAKILIPGIVRVQARVKVSSGSETLKWTIGGPNDTDGWDFFASDVDAFSFSSSISNTQYNNEEVDIRVRAGDEVGVYGTGITCEHLKIRFTPTRTTTYAEIL